MLLRLLLRSFMVSPLSPSTLPVLSLSRIRFLVHPVASRIVMKSRARVRKVVVVGVAAVASEVSPRAPVVGSM